jgi:hypothetical protein
VDVLSGASFDRSVHAALRAATLQLMRDASAHEQEERRCAISITRNQKDQTTLFKAQQELEFDRWRTAVVIVERMRRLELVANFLVSKRPPLPLFARIRFF